jgi:predicted alpha/beta hydrolase family esterase
MTHQILFIQGGGNDGHEADKALVHSLQAILGADYHIVYPELQFDESSPDFGWIDQIARHVSDANDDVIIVAHSLGASMLLKYLSDHSVTKKMKGIFLIATPFWSGDEDWKQGLKLKEAFADTLPAEAPVYFYHCKDDEEVPFSHMDEYRQRIEQATFREIENGGHQPNNCLAVVARDIRSL